MNEAEGAGGSSLGDLPTNSGRQHLAARTGRVEVIEGKKPEDLVKVENLCKNYSLGGFRSKNRVLRAVSDVSFTISAGRTFGLVGETGSGKSTIGKLTLGLETPSWGRVMVAGNDLALLSKKELRDLRREMQPVSQDPYSALNGRMRVRDILGEPFIIHKTADKRELHSLVQDLLELVDLPKDAIDRFPHQFSGGQRQRLVIARAVALRPRFVVADEPLSALDVSVQAQIINLFKKLQREFNLTYLFISHDLSVVRYLSDVVGVMYLGRLVELGTRDDVFSDASHPYTQALLASAPAVGTKKLVEKRRLHLYGDPPAVLDGFSGCVFNSRCPIAESRCFEQTPEFRDLGENHMVACHFAPVSVDVLSKAVERRSAKAESQD